MLPAKRILVVDDEMLIRQVNAGVLRRAGYQTETAENGEAAWGALKANSYDLLITDNKMPKVSGLELVKKLRAAHMSLPVIFISGAIPSEACDSQGDLQIAAALTKPVSARELVGIVEKVLRTGERARGAVRCRAPQTLHHAAGHGHKHSAPRSWRRHVLGD